MDNQWLDRWNKRYSAKEYAYGTEPNEFLKEQLSKLKPGTILFGAEGEGRNSVYAAILGWDVSAFDISIEGQKKAQALAKENGVSIDYQVGLLPELNFKKEPFDAIVLIYAHFPAPVKSQYHKILDQHLKKGGMIIFEAFSKSHLEYRAKNEKVGGPNDLDTLYSIEEIKSDFNNYEIIELEEKVIDLSEGLYHNGRGSAIRFVGRKK